MRTASSAQRVRARPHPYRGEQGRRGSSSRQKRRRRSGNPRGDQEGGRFAEEARQVLGRPNKTRAGPRVLRAWAHVPEFEKAAFALKTGQMSGVVETPSATTSSRLPTIRWRAPFPTTAKQNIEQYLGNQKNSRCSRPISTACARYRRCSSSIRASRADIPGTNNENESALHGEGALFIFASIVGVLQRRIFPGGDARERRDGVRLLVPCLRQRMRLQ